MAAVYLSMGLDPPSHFRWYESPFGALSDFDAWRGATGPVANFLFDYQMPRCDPESYYRRGVQSARVGESAVELGLRRLPHVPGLASTYAPPAEEVGGVVVSRALLDELWIRIVGFVGRGWCSAVNDIAQEEFEHVFDALLDVISGEDPTSQMREWEYIYLGPIDRFAWEAACSEACAHILGARVDSAHVRALGNMVRECGTVYAFGDLVIMCERPESILPVGPNSEGVTALCFHDGTQRVVTL